MGGTVFYDSEPTVSYRVHPRNVIGSNRSAAAQILRARMLWQGRFQAWADMNVAALERIESLMTDENRKTFELFRLSRKQSLLPRAVRAYAFRHLPANIVGQYRLGGGDVDRTDLKSPLTPPSWRRRSYV